MIECALLSFDYINIRSHGIVVVSLKTDISFRLSAFKLQLLLEINFKLVVNRNFRT